MPDKIDIKAPFRKLRGYAFDPSLSLQLETVRVNNIVYKVEWETLFKLNPDDTRSFPSGQYVEIIDFDPATGVFYPAVNLDDINLVIQDGHFPNINNPQFHQQMVYAVVMTTIKNFEKALGRKIQWSEHIYIDKNGKLQSDFVRQLRIYPHALRQANAYYHPDKKALLFGYFNASNPNPQLMMPSSTVFTCLSHDIIAHEATHAILDGLHRRYIEPTHPDTRAFHEGFADIIALFQHFTFPEVLRHQIAKTKGNLESQNLLGQLAQEFGKAIGGYGSLRDAIGKFDPVSKEWILDAGSPTDYQTKMEFHERGSILVAAVFNAFLNIYKLRIQPLLRIATGGSGILPAGELHPDLVNELSSIASKTAGHVLNMCVRALDYCPPIDLTYGDYLRGIITADIDMVPEDMHDYRIAFIEAFQRRGIYPQGLKNMSVETLCHSSYPDMKAEKLERVFVDFLREMKEHLNYETDRKKIYEKTKQFIQGEGVNMMGLHKRVTVKFLQGEGCQRFSELTGLAFPSNKTSCEKLGIQFSAINNSAVFEIGNVWLSNRTTPDGKIVNDVIMTLLQRRDLVAAIDDNKFTAHSKSSLPKNFKKGTEFMFRGGCTLIFDLDTLKLKYAIKKDITDSNRMEQQFRHITHNDGEDHDSGSLYFNTEELASISGAFAFMHSHNH